MLLPTPLFKKPKFLRREFERVGFVGLVSRADFFRRGEFNDIPPPLLLPPPPPLLSSKLYRPPDGEPNPNLGISLFID